MQAARGFGWVFCDWRCRARQGAPEAKDVDEYVFAALGGDAETTSEGGYREVTAAEARHIVGYCMKHSMAYGPALSAVGLVANAVEPFFQLFAAARYFTNSGFADTNASWQFIPKTQHTFDSGIVAVDAVNIGLVWFADED